MKLNLHNKIEISIDGKTYCFYNTMLKSVIDRLRYGKKFNTHLAVGTGTLGVSKDFKLSNFEKAVPLETEILQDDIKSQSASGLYVKKSAVIDAQELIGKYITEAGITSGIGELYLDGSTGFDDENIENQNDETNPTIYNYFSLISSECPNGILVTKNNPILISVYIYLNLSVTGSGLFCSGKNKFIDFLLGEGLSESVYACRGRNLATNAKSIEKVLDKNSGYSKFKSTMYFQESKDGYNLYFSTDIWADETYEVILLVGDSPFARINVLETSPEIRQTITKTPKRNYVIDMGENVKSVESVLNKTSGGIETDVYVSNYAKRFADKIVLPFDGLFSNETPRFLSKDGKLIFFVYEDRVYAYKNFNHNIVKLSTENVKVSNITNIVAFDEFVFIFSKSHPYIFAYRIEGETLIACDINLNDYMYNQKLGTAYKIDITLAKNGSFMLAFIDYETKYGHVVYWTFDSLSNTFLYDADFVSENNYTYLLAMLKNNFSDACIMFVKADESQYSTRLAYYYPDKTYKDLYTTLAVAFTENTKEIYTKNRAVIIEKTTSPHIWVYFYPQLYRYTLSLFGDEENDYISTNLHYLIQKYGKGDYKIFNLVGYDTPEEFSAGLDSIVDTNKILDFEFVGDTLLIFMDDEFEPIVAYNFFENRVLIENVSENECEYEVSHTKFDVLGKNNEGVVVDFTVKINI